MIEEMGRKICFVVFNPAHESELQKKFSRLSEALSGKERPD